MQLTTNTLFLLVFRFNENRYKKNDAGNQEDDTADKRQGIMISPARGHK